MNVVNNTKNTILKTVIARIISINVNPLFFIIAGYLNIVLTLAKGRTKSKLNLRNRKVHMRHSFYSYTDAMALIPTVIDKTPQGERAYDIYSRLLEDRIIFVGEAVEPFMVNSIVAQMLYLEKKDPDKEIIMHINTPGGEIYSGMAIFDTMQHIKCDVVTICAGLAASMGSIFLVG
jgi:ClpP class serine protease